MTTPHDSYYDQDRLYGNSVADEAYAKAMEEIDGTVEPPDDRQAREWLPVVRCDVHAGRHEEDADCEWPHEITCGGDLPQVGHPYTSAS